MYSEERMVIPEKIIIPKLSNEELIALYERIRPIVEFKDEKYLLRKFTLDQIINTSYIYNIEDDIRVLVDQEDLETVEEFPCFHTYGYPGFFKPSIGEVLSQLPEKSKIESKYFEMIEEPDTVEDLNMYFDVIDKGYHVSKIRTYKIHK